MKANRKMIFRRKLVAVAVASCFTITPAFANPIGATVVNGQVGFATQGSTLTVTNSPNSIINWQQFSINTGETTRFVQQSTQSAVLNRVVGQDPSQLLGSLLSNGRVYLINPNGILFGQGAVIDVGGLVASTLKLTDGDFLAGRLNFTGGVGAGSINNQGSITTPTGGSVYLIAPDITNSGIITSPQGEILLAAGHTVNLMDTTTPNVQVTVGAPDTQAVNIGSLIARSGKVGIYSALINQQGLVDANTAVVGANGKITLRASKDITLEPGSVTTASGMAGGVKDGGEIRIVADGKLNVKSGSAIHVDGGAQGGNGGFLELSGKQNIALNGTYTGAAKAAGYHGGTLLLDPQNINIVAVGGTTLGASSLAASGGTSASVLTLNRDMTGAAFGTINLTAGRDITLSDPLRNTDLNVNTTQLTLNAVRDISIGAQIGGLGTGTNARFAHDLTLTAGNNVNINNSIYLGSNTLTLAAGTAATPASGDVNILASNFGNINVYTLGNMIVSGRDFNVNHEVGNTNTYGVSIDVGGQLSVAMTRDITIQGGSNSCDGQFCQYQTVVQAGSIDIISGRNLLLQAGSLGSSSSGEAYVDVSTTGNININVSGQLAVRGGTINTNSMSGGTDDVHARLYAGGDLTILHAGSVEVKGGTFNMASNYGGNSSNTFDASALLGAGNAVSITATGAVEVLGGTVNVSPYYYSFSDNAVNVSAAITADAGSVTVTAGSVTVQGGTVNLSSASSDIGSFWSVNTFNASAKINAASGDVSITATGGPVEVLGGSINITDNSNDVRYNDVDATALVEGNNVTITAGSVTVAGGAVVLSGGTSSASYNTFNASAKINAASGDVSITASGAVEVLGGGITISGNDYDPFASSNSMIAAAAIAGQNVTIGAGSLKVQGGTISVASNSSSGQYNSLDVSARIEAASGNLGITTTGAVQVLGGDVTFSNNFGGFSFDSNSFYADAKLYASNAVTITSGSLAVAGGSATLSGSPSSNYLNLNAQVYAGIGDVTLATAGNINVTGGTVIGASASNTIYANATIGAANEVLATIGGTAITINAGTITGGDTAYADARIESAIPTTIRVSFTNLTSGGYSVNGIDGAITDGNSGFYAFGSPGILDSTLFFQYATALPDSVLGAAGFGNNELNNATNFDAFFEPIRFGEEHEDKKNEKPVCR